MMHDEPPGVAVTSVDAGDRRGVRRPRLSLCSRRIDERCGLVAEDHDPDIVDRDVLPGLGARSTLERRLAIDDPPTGEDVQSVIRRVLGIGLTIPGRAPEGALQLKKSRLEIRSHPVRLLSRD